MGEPQEVCRKWPSRSTFDNPKSAILRSACSESPSAVSSRFSGFRSLCTTPAAALPTVGRHQDRREWHPGPSSGRPPGTLFCTVMPNTMRRRPSRFARQDDTTSGTKVCRAAQRLHTSCVAGLDAGDQLLEEAAGGALVQPAAHVEEVKQLARLQAQTARRHSEYTYHMPCSAHTPSRCQHSGALLQAFRGQLHTATYSMIR